MHARFCFRVYFERAEDLLQTDVAFKSWMFLQLEFQSVVCSRNREGSTFENFADLNFHLKNDM